MYNFVNAFRRWQRNQATIQELSRLDDRTLNDIGVVRADITSIVRRHK